MKWKKTYVFPHIYINFSPLSSLQNPPKIISLKKSVTPATLNDYQAFMVTGRRFPATFLPPQANLVPTFSTYWNFLFQLVGELVPANGTASHFLLFQNISIPVPKTNEPGYTRRTNSPSRGVLVSSTEPIGIGRIAYGRKLPSLRWCWLLWLWWCG